MDVTTDDGIRVTGASLCPEVVHCRYGATNSRITWACRTQGCVMKAVKNQALKGGLIGS